MITSEIFLNIMGEASFRSIDENRRFGYCLFHVTVKKFPDVCERSIQEGFNPEYDDSNIGKFIGALMDLFVVI